VAAGFLMLVTCLVGAMAGCGSSDSIDYPSPGVTPTPSAAPLPSSVAPNPDAENMRTPQPTCCTPAPPTPLVRSAPVVVDAQLLSLDLSSNGKTFQVRVGTRIGVQVALPTQGYQMTPPQSTNPAVLSLSAAAVEHGGVTGAFLATTAGHADLVAWADPTCLRSSPPCDRSSVGWNVTILVMS
jgi:hypothetical protein